MLHNNRNISTRETTRVVNWADTRILYLGHVGKDYIASNWQEKFEKVRVWCHVRRSAAVKDSFGWVGTYSVSHFLDSSHHFSTICMSPSFKVFRRGPYMTGRSAWWVLTTAVTLLTTQIGRGGTPFRLLLIHLSIRWRDGVNLVLRLGVLRGSSGGSTRVGGENQDTHLCIVVGKVVFWR
jgi:hypothetical protein